MAGLESEFAEPKGIEETFSPLELSLIRTCSLDPQKFLDFLGLVGKASPTQTVRFFQKEGQAAGVLIIFPGFESLFENFRFKKPITGQQGTKNKKLPQETIDGIFARLAEKPRPKLQDIASEFGIGKSTVTKYKDLFECRI